MPSTKTLSRKEVLQGGLDLLRKQGPGAITARTLAKKLKCSTQPIYSAFAGMKDFERALLREVRRIYREFVIDDQGGDSPFENIGLGYLRFAREEPRLFNWMIESGRLKVDFNSKKHSPEFQLGLERMATDPTLEGLEQHQIERLQRNLWIYTHGLAVLLSSGMLRADEKTARGYMNEMAEIAITMEYINKRKQ